MFGFGKKREEGEDCKVFIRKGDMYKLVDGLLIFNSEKGELVKYRKVDDGKTAVCVVPEVYPKKWLNRVRLVAVDDGKVVALPVGDVKSSVEYGSEFVGEFIEKQTVIELFRATGSTKGDMLKWLPIITLVVMCGVIYMVYQLQGGIDGLKVAIEGIRDIIIPPIIGGS